MNNKEIDKTFEDDIDIIKRTKKKTIPPKIEIANASIVEEKPKVVVTPVEEPIIPKPNNKPFQKNRSDESKEKRLRFGQSHNREQVYISDKSRFANILILGAKNSGKSSTVLPMLARQDILNPECGITFVVDKKDVAYTLYAMAKDAGRKVVILKPSANFDIANDFIQRTKYDYDYIHDNVINYKDAIKKKMVVIIDMEYAKYRQNAIRATAMLLMQLQIDMQDTQYTLKRPHFVYIDDSHRYLPFVELLLTSGDDYGMGSILFLQGRAQLNMYDSDYSSLIDVNVRNTILMNGITYEDAKYYSERFFDFTVKDLLDRKEGQIMYEIVGSTNSRSTGKCGLVFLSDSVKNSIEEKAKKARKQLNKFSRKAELEISLREEEELSKLNKLNKLRVEQSSKVIEEPAKEETPLIAQEILTTERRKVTKISPITPTVLEVMDSIPKPSVKEEVEAKAIHEAEDIGESSFMEKDLIDFPSMPGLDDNLLSELAALNDLDIPDDGLSAYSESEPDDEESEEDVSDMDVISDARKMLTEQDDDVIELNDTLSVDSLGDEYLHQARGYKPIKVNMPRNQKAIIASERYMNDMLNKKLK